MELAMSAEDCGYLTYRYIVLMYAAAINVSLIIGA